jgi:hypothetical protein
MAPEIIPRQVVFEKEAICGLKVAEFIWLLNRRLSDPYFLLGTFTDVAELHLHNPHIGGGFGEWSTVRKEEKVYRRIVAARLEEQINVFGPGAEVARYEANSRHRL